MEIDDLNSILVGIVEKRMELGRLNYSDQSYDEIEEELHNLEDELVENFGNDLEEVFKTIHQKHCPDTEVLSPIAYLAKNYHKVGKHPNGSALYEVADLKQGVVIDSDVYDQAYLVMIPNPIRVLLTVPYKSLKEEVWNIEEQMGMAN